MENKVYVITAAGGNATAIMVLPEAKTRAEYEKIGRDLIFDNQDKSVEQAGFLIIADQHFEMSGGEFCGNAARAVAILFSKLNGKNQVEFTMSGFPKTVRASLSELTPGQFLVECHFPEMPLQVSAVDVGQEAQLVDLGGIVHVIIEAEFPVDDFETKHRQITKSLNLDNREAVGVVWAKKDEFTAKIDPVVWVKGVDSFFYESSCGSGSIAAAKVLGFSQIFQPTGKVITVLIKEKEVILTSEMEVKDGEN